MSSTKARECVSTGDCGECSFRYESSLRIQRTCLHPSAVDLPRLQSQNARRWDTWRRAMTEEFDEDVVFQVRSIFLGCVRLLSVNINWG